MTTAKELLDYYRSNFHSANRKSLDTLNSQVQYSYLNPSIKMWRPGEAGDKKIRFLPVTLPTPSDGVSWGYKACVYYGVLPDHSSVASPAMFDPDARDPFAEVLGNLVRRHPEAKNVLYSHRSWRWATYVLDRKVPGEPLVWMLPKRVFEVLYSGAKDSAEAGLPSFDDLFAGSDFNFKFVHLGGDRKNSSYEGMAFSRAQTPVTNSDDSIARLIAWIMEHPISQQFVRLPTDVTDSLAERFEEILKAEIEGASDNLNDQTDAINGIEERLSKRTFVSSSIPAQQEYFGSPTGTPRAAPVLSSVPAGVVNPGRYIHSTETSLGTHEDAFPSVSSKTRELVDSLSEENLNAAVKKYGIHTEGKTFVEIVDACVQHALDEESGSGKHA